jgi:hypothetical protein
MNFHQMQNLKAGILNRYDFNLTSICITNGLDIGTKEKCKDLQIDMWPSEMGALLFYQVRNWKLNNLRSS